MSILFYNFSLFFLDFVVLAVVFGYFYAVNEENKPIDGQGSDSAHNKEKRPVEDYLHKIDLESLKNDTGLSIDELAKVAGIKEARNLGKWAQSKPDGSRPNYNALVRLLMRGATVETLFGVNYKNKFKPNDFSVECDEIFNSPYFNKKLQEKIEELKRKGIL